MGKTRAECSQNAYYKCFFRPLNTNFSKFFAQIWPKKKKKKTPCFFAFYGRSGEGNITTTKIWPNVSGSAWDISFLCIQLDLSYPDISIIRQQSCSVYCPFFIYFHLKSCSKQKEINFCLISLLFCIKYNLLQIQYNRHKPYWTCFKHITPISGQIAYNNIRLDAFRTYAWPLAR